MKKNVTLFVLLSLFGAVLAQPTVPVLQPGPESSGIDTRFLMRNKIRAVEVSTYAGTDVAKTAPASSITYTYDTGGKLIKSEEKQKTDVSRVNEFTYTENGTLAWKQTTDYVVKRNFRTGYRFNGNQTVFQVKSYEMLSNNQKLLLDTRQYVYTQDSLLSEIRWVENNRVTRSQLFSYDKEGRITAETHVDAAGKQVKKVSYVYDTQFRITALRIEDAGSFRDFAYQYDPRGNPVKIEWSENNIVRGTITYTYDERGLPALATRTLNPGTKVSAVSTHVYRYPSFQ